MYRIHIYFAKVDNNLRASKIHKQRHKSHVDLLKKVLVNFK